MSVYGCGRPEHAGRDCWRCHLCAVCVDDCDCGDDRCPGCWARECDCETDEWPDEADLPPLPPLRPVIEIHLPETTEETPDAHA